MTITYDDIQAWVGIFTMVTAIVAIVLSIRTERRAQARWDDDLKRGERFAAASSRPLLTVSSIGYLNRRGLRLSNNGLGPAIIKRVEIVNGDRSGNTVPDVIDVGRDVVWNTFRRFAPPFLPIAAGQDRTIVELTLDALKSQKLSDDDAEAVMRRLGDQLRAVRIRIDYEDVLKNEQRPCLWNYVDDNSAEQ